MRGGLLSLLLFQGHCDACLGRLQAGQSAGYPGCALPVKCGLLRNRPSPSSSLHPRPRPRLRPVSSAGVMSTLHHPNVCHLLAITRQPAALVMEYASRRSIDKLLAAGLRDAKVGRLRSGAQGRAGCIGKTGQGLLRGRAAAGRWVAMCDLQGRFQQRY